MSIHLYRPKPSMLSRIQARLLVLSEKDEEVDKEKEDRQIKEGKQPKHDTDLTEDRMFGEHDPENLEPPEEEVEEDEIPEADEEEDTSTEVSEDETQEDDGSDDEEMIDDESPVEGEPPAQEQPDELPTESEEQQVEAPEPNLKEFEHKVAKEFMKGMAEAEGQDAEDYKQMEGIWHKTRGFEDNGLDPEEFTKDSLTFRGKPKDYHGLTRALKSMGKGKLEIDEQGNTTGSIEIDGRKVSVSVHKIGRDGEALVSFYPMLEIKKEEPAPPSNPSQEEPVSKEMDDEENRLPPMPPPPEAARIKRL